MRCETESQNFMTMYAVGRGGLMHYGFIYTAYAIDRFSP